MTNFPSPVITTDYEEDQNFKYPEYRLFIYCESPEHAKYVFSLFEKTAGVGSSPFSYAALSTSEARVTLDVRGWHCYTDEDREEVFLQVIDLLGGNVISSLYPPKEVNVEKKERPKLLFIWHKANLYAELVSEYREELNYLASLLFGEKPSNFSIKPKYVGRYLDSIVLDPPYDFAIELNCKEEIYNWLLSKVGDKFEIELVEK